MGADVSSLGPVSHGRDIAESLGPCNVSAVDNRKAVGSAFSNLFQLERNPAVRAHKSDLLNRNDSRTIGDGSAQDAVILRKKSHDGRIACEG